MAECTGVWILSFSDGRVDRCLDSLLFWRAVSFVFLSPLIADWTGCVFKQGWGGGGGGGWRAVSFVFLSLLIADWTGCVRLDRVCQIGQGVSDWTGCVIKDAGRQQFDLYTCILISSDCSLTACVIEHAGRGQFHLQSYLS